VCNFLLVYLVPLEAEAEESIGYWRNLEIWVRDGSRSLKMSPIDNHANLYSSTVSHCKYSCPISSFLQHWKRIGRLVNQFDKLKFFHGNPPTDWRSEAKPVGGAQADK